MYEYLYQLSLVDNNGRRKKRLFLVDELRNFKPVENRNVNCDFLTEWLKSHKQEMRSYFRGLRGFLCLEIIEVETGTYIAGSDFIE